MTELDWEERTALRARFRELSTAAVDDLLKEEIEDEDYDNDGYEERGYYSWYETYATREIPGLGVVTLVERHGGSEGQGEDASLVFRVTREHCGDRFFKKEGYYQSYDGAHYDGELYEVQPVTRTVTVFEKV